MGDDGRPRYGGEELRRFMQGVMEHHGMAPADAAVASTNLVDADLCGVDTHGISNFVGHWHYAPGLGDGSVSPCPTVAVLRDSPVSAALDAGRGFGPLVADRAMAMAIDKAARTGIGMVTVRDGCHFGATGTYARKAADAGMIGMVACHTAPAVVAPGGADKVVGTNPMAFAAPVAGHHPFVLDMATTTAAGTKLQVARRRGEPIPLGWAVDADGNGTTDPGAALGGGLLSLGSGDGGGHKGFGLALVVDILSGVLSGTGPGISTTFGPAWRQGAWFAAWRIDTFVDPERFAADMVHLTTSIREARRAPGAAPVLVPGDRQAAHRADRAARGIPLDDALVTSCRALAASTGVAFPGPLA